MDNETIGLEDKFIARHTTDPALPSMLSNRETLTRQRPPEVKINPYKKPISQYTLVWTHGGGVLFMLAFHEFLFTLFFELHLE